MRDNEFAVQELESRFELETFVMQDGTQFDASAISGDALNEKLDCECTSTCRPK